MRFAHPTAALAAFALLGASAARAASPELDMTVMTGPAGEMTIVRGGPGGPYGHGAREALHYIDGSGEPVRVYADHPVTRAEVEARLAQANREAERARAEGRRAAEQGRRAAAEGRRAAEEGRRAAQEGRLEAERARAEGRRAMEEGRREAAEARAEALRVTTD